MLTSPTIRYDASLSDSVSSVSLDDESHMEEQYDARSASHDSPKDVPAKEVIDERAQVAPWRPFWLRSALLATFCGIFLALVVALSIMLIYSRRNDGLGSARSSLRHLWRFGPTAGKIYIQR